MILMTQTTQIIGPQIHPGTTIGMSQITVMILMSLLRIINKEEQMAKNLIISAMILMTQTTQMIDQIHPGTTIGMSQITAMIVISLLRTINREGQRIKNLIISAAMILMTQTTQMIGPQIHPGTTIGMSQITAMIVISLLRTINREGQRFKNFIISAAMILMTQMIGPQIIVISLLRTINREGQRAKNLIIITAMILITTQMILPQIHPGTTIGMFQITPITTMIVISLL